jgi:hypothetical protein
MSNYRLKIEELGNGTKKYYIEKALLITTRGWIRQQRIEWKNYTGAFSCEETAMRALARIKAEDEERIAKQVVKTTYKDIN